MTGQRKDLALGLNLITSAVSDTGSNAPQANRIKPDDVLADIMSKMAESDRIALCALHSAHIFGSQIDPNAGAIAGLHTMQELDHMQVYGARLAHLFEQVCRRSPVLLAAIGRGRKLGLVDVSAVQAAADGGETPLCVDTLLEQVQAELPEFGRVKVTV